MLRAIAQTHSGGCLTIAKRMDDGSISFLGTCFLASNKGHLLTCAHLINLTDKLAVVPSLPINDFNPMRLTQVQAFHVTVAQFDPVHDMALLKLDASVTSAIPPNLFAKTEQTPVGASACYFGFPFGHIGLHTLKLSNCTISSKSISESGTKQYQIDSMVHEGNSGGPLIEVSSGQVIGVINSRFSPTGNHALIKIGNHSLGTESNVSFANSIVYGLDLLKAEGINV